MDYKLDFKEKNQVLNLDLIFNIAKLYYEDSLTQESISRRLNISKYRVHRLLKKAKEVGIVQINILRL